MPLADTKIWYKSAAIQGNIVTVVGLVIKWLGLPVLASEGEAIVSIVFVLVGIAYAIYGRVKAEAPIGWGIN